MKYSITTQPQRVLPGWQADTTLINQGPGTVYVGSDGTVSAINGFPLKPTASMTWDAGSELWLASASTSSVIAEPVAQLVNTPNVLPFDLLYNQSGAQQTITVECGSYNALRFIIRKIQTQPQPINCFVGVTFNWFDSNGNSILYEDVWIPSSPASSNQDGLAVVLVKGSSVTITIPYLNNSLISIFGDNRSTQFYTGFVLGPAVCYNLSNTVETMALGTAKAASFANGPAVPGGAWGTTPANNGIIIGAIGVPSMVTITIPVNAVSGTVSIQSPTGYVGVAVINGAPGVPANPFISQFSFLQPADTPVLLTSSAFPSTGGITTSNLSMSREPISDGGASFLTSKVRVAATSAPSNSVGLAQLSVLGVNFTVSNSAQKFLVTCTGTAQRGSGDTVMIGYTGIDGTAVSSQHLLSINSTSAFGTLTFQDVVTGLSPGAHAASYIIASNSANTFNTYGGYTISVEEL